MIINFINVVMIHFVFCVGGGGILTERKVYGFWVDAKHK